MKRRMRFLEDRYKPATAITRIVPDKEPHSPEIRGTPRKILRE
ncbi:hypothetical protein HMPREF0198_0115 [Cardiobacterium hominis ATCC 15826]|uniref:Uncharacterized protein n=1 Tax=Cardiobacterium hominis (strain ATCC 15826 / DSM 8339 / NCTC 10426 / 6573) TaxID=638300 RepID=C8N6I9_CARH6|nr:hypothetical protein HMPREF0198_0115 [Cardiobacterium hominis ATCC 15826]